MFRGVISRTDTQTEKCGSPSSQVTKSVHLHISDLWRSPHSVEIFSLLPEKMKTKYFSDHNFFCHWHDPSPHAGTGDFTNFARFWLGMLSKYSHKSPKSVEISTQCRLLAFAPVGVQNHHHTDSGCVADT